MTARSYNTFSSFIPDIPIFQDFKKLLGGKIYYVEQITKLKERKKHTISA